MKLKRLTAWLLGLTVLLTLPAALSACAGKDPVVMEVGGEKVTYNLLRYFVKNHMDDTGYSETEFQQDEALQEELTEAVYGSVRMLIACRILAEEHDLALNDSEKEEIDEQITALKDSYADEDAFLQALQAQYMTEDVCREILQLRALGSKLYTYLTDEYTGIFRSDNPTVDADIESGNFFSAEYLYVYCGESDREEKAQFADALRERIVSGESMSVIDREFETTYGLKMDYCSLPAFTYTEEVQYFEDAVLALSVGEVSSVIERSDGFLIVKRLELSQDYINSNYMSIVSSYLTREYNRYMEDYAAGLEIEWKSKYEDLKFWEME